ncbi:hypothetical protein ES705_24796 [subsurface metagenome]
MKRLIIILIVGATIALTGCEKHEEDSTQKAIRELEIATAEFHKFKSRICDSLLVAGDMVNAPFWCYNGHTCDSLLFAEDRVNAEYFCLW